MNIMLVKNLTTKDIFLSPCYFTLKDHFNLFHIYMFLLLAVGILHLPPKSKHGVFYYFENYSEALRKNPFGRRMKTTL